MTEYFARRAEAVGYVRAIYVILFWSALGLWLIAGGLGFWGVLAWLPVFVMVLSMRWRVRRIVAAKPELEPAGATVLERNMARNDLRIRLLFGAGLREALGLAGLPELAWLLGARALILANVVGFVGLFFGPA